MSDRPSFTARIVIDRLTSQNGMGVLGFIGGAGSVLAAAGQLKASGDTFVMPPEEQAEPNDTGTQVVHQQVRVQFRVIVGFTGIGAAGDEQTDAIDAAREFLKDVLIGWTPAGEISPIEFVSAGTAVLDTDKGYLLYACDFQTRYHFRSP